MTKFQVEEFRHFCRNTKCRSKLKTPVSNKREAFCARGCHTAFYRKRCLVCEGPIERNRDDQKICGKAMCRSAWRARTGFGRYIGSSAAKLPSKKPVNKGPKGAPKRDPRSVSWLIVAGPPEGISANALHCATVSDGPNCQWKGGEFERVEAKKRAALKAADEAAIEDNGYFTDTDWHEVVSPDGVKCFVTSSVAPAQRALALLHPLTADLSIPEFLRRT